MNKAIQPKTKLITFKCASCGAEYKIGSTLKQDTYSLDVCANCHPFYKGGASDQKVKGRAEKLSSKFAAGLEKPTTKKTETKKSASKKIVKSLSDL